MKTKTQKDKTDEIYESVRIIEKMITLLFIKINEKFNLLVTFILGVFFIKEFLWR